MIALFGGGVIGLLFFLIATAAFVFWLWMLIDVITNKALPGTEKIIWVLVVLFLHFLGALIYYFVGRSKVGR
jgi:hypothetical protein